MNPYVFLVGCPRSGTTLLGRIADAHPELAVIHETRWIPRCFENREGLTMNGSVAPSLAERLRDVRVLRPLGIAESEMERLIRDHDGAHHFSTFVTAEMATASVLGIPGPTPLGGSPESTGSEGSKNPALAWPGPPKRESSHPLLMLV